MKSETRIQIDASRPEDRAAIGEIARRAGVFTREEKDSIFELFDTHLQSPDSGYEWFSARAGERVVGFACYGPTPFAQGAYDLYWICTDPDGQGRGVGRALFAAMDAEIRNRKGRLMMIWTSGGREYMPASKFYERMGCELSARIRDYYKPGEDMVVFVKYYNSNP
ncbi:MAG: GNAT family N-acetyltransferase [Anaerolineales bacterium]|nr:GNAT family N-acetyltransferase [Anaerolineales bacterium]